MARSSMKFDVVFKVQILVNGTNCDILEHEVIKMPGQKMPTYPAIEPKRFTGLEPLIAPDGCAVGKLTDFWSWAYSDLMGNAERGALAEYIVACALGIETKKRVSWDRYDLMTENGIAVEVKTSGYLQTWEQKALSKPIFGIQPTFGWDSKTNEYEAEKKRQSDIYVFCVHAHTDQETADPLQICQWEFYLMPTKLIDEQFGNQKTVTLASLVRAGAEKCEYSDLKNRIYAVMQK